MAKKKSCATEKDHSVPQRKKMTINKILDPYQRQAIFEENGGLIDEDSDSLISVDAEDAEDDVNEANTANAEDDADAVNHYAVFNTSTEDSYEPRITDTVKTTQVTHSVKIKIDLANAKRFLRSNKADELYIGKDILKAHLRGHSYRSILLSYLVNYVDPDIDDPENVGWVKVDYHLCAGGHALRKLGIITGAREYAGSCDPFSLPGILNDLLTGKFYRNWDDSKAYQRYLLAITRIPAAQAVLSEFLVQPNALISDLAERYGVAYSDIKTLLHRLSMDGSLQAWRKEKGIPAHIKDDLFIVRYAKAMQEVTTELVQRIPYAKRRAVIKYFIDKEDKRHPERSVKSFLLQNIEFKARKAKLAALAKYGIRHGSLEHDGIKELLGPNSPDATTMAQILTQAASQAVAKAIGGTAVVEIPVCLKEADAIDYGLYHDAFAPRMHIAISDLTATPALKKVRGDLKEVEKQLEINSSNALKRQKETLKEMLVAIEDKREDRYRAVYLDLMNHYFRSMTAMGDAVAQLEFYPGTNHVSNYALRRNGVLSTAFAGMPTPCGNEEKTQPLVYWWRTHPKRATHERIGFYPNADLAKRHPRDLNTFGGLPFDHLHVPAELDYGLLQPLLDHILNVLAVGDRAHYEFQLNWYAACLQRRTKLKSILIYLGEQGCGKDLLVGDEGIMAHIFSRHHQKVANITNLFDRFNVNACGILFTVLDEVTPYNKSFRNNDFFKDTVTGKRMRIEPKGVDPFETDDQRNFVATTNNRNGFKFEPCERRQYMIEVNSEWSAGGLHTKEEQHRHFAEVLGARYGQEEPARDATYEEIEAVAKQFYWFLMRRDIAGFNARDFPTSEVREEQLDLHVDPMAEFFEQWRGGYLHDGCNLPYDDNAWDTTKSYLAKDVLTIYRIYCQQANIPCEITAKQLSHHLKKYPQYIAPLGSLSSASSRAGRSKLGNVFKLVAIP